MCKETSVLVMVLGVGLAGTRVIQIPVSSCACMCVCVYVNFYWFSGLRKMFRKHISKSQLGASQPWSYKNYPSSQCTLRLRWFYCTGRNVGK